jgi:hypothetical protein
VTAIFKEIGTCSKRQEEIFTNWEQVSFK